jgi:hypothetical protein
MTASDTGEAKVADVGMNALFMLEQGKPVKGKDLARGIELLPARAKDGQALMSRGAKALWKKGDLAERYDMVFPTDIGANLGMTEFMAEQVKTGGWARLVDGGSDWRTSAARWGDLVLRPKIRVGTIHSVKGMEADNVCLLGTTSKRCEQAMLDSQEQWNEECRLAYVAVTRARKRLVIAANGFGMPAMPVSV